MTGADLSGMLRGVHRQALIVIALMLAFGGTSTAAKKLVTGRDIKDGSLRSADIANGSLQRADFKRGEAPRGRRGPTGKRGPWGPAGPVAAYKDERVPVAYGTVAADGTSRLTVDHPATSVYCLRIAGALWAQATSAANPPRTATARAYTGYQSPDPPCSAATTVRVDTGSTDSAFQILARTG